MKKQALLLIQALTFLLPLTSCMSPPTDQDVHTPQTIKEFFQKPQDPRRFGLTVYQSKYGPIFSGSKRLHDFQTAKSDFEGRNAYIPVVEVKGQKLEVVDALLDTGSRDSWLTLDAAYLLAAQPLGPPPYRRLADHVGETEPGIAIYITKLRIGEIHVENMIAYVRIPQITLGPLARKADDPKPEVVLGCDLLRTFSFVRFDYPNHCVYLSADRKYEGSQDFLLESVPYERVNGTLAVKALIDGEPVQAIIDTGGDYEIAWNKPDETVIRQLFIGELALLDVHITNAETLQLGYPEIPRIGARLLRKFAVTIDNKQRRIVFERPVESGLFHREKKESTKPEPSTWVPN